jgi:hypothetical protein
VFNFKDYFIWHIFGIDNICFYSILNYFYI